MRIEISSLLDLDVYTQKGIFVGRVDDAVLDPDQGTISSLALGRVNRSLFNFDAKRVVIPYDWVTAIGDIILMRHFTRAAEKNEEKDRS